MDQSRRERDTLQQMNHVALDQLGLVCLWREVLAESCCWNMLINHGSGLNHPHLAMMFSLSCFLFGVSTVHAFICFKLTQIYQSLNQTIPGLSAGCSGTKKTLKYSQDDSCEVSCFRCFVLNVVTIIQIYNATLLKVTASTYFMHIVREKKSTYACRIAPVDM